MLTPKNIEQNIYVSVIIPVYNDRVRLKLCLEALSAQSYPHSRYEIVVVDNNSTEDIESIVGEYSNAVYAAELQVGSYAARNKGLSIARGTVLAFTDSDCIPASDWIKKGVERVLDIEDCGLVAGRIDFYFQRPGKPTIAEVYDSLNFLKQQQYVEVEHYGATANLFTLRSVFDAVGLFDEQLKSGGDRAWGKKVFAAGYRQVYAEDVCISHPARQSIQDLKKKLVRVVEGQYKSAKHKKNSKIGVIAAYLYDAKPSLKGIFELLFIEKQPQKLTHRLGCVYLYMSLRNARAWKKLQLNLSK